MSKPEAMLIWKNYNQEIHSSLFCLLQNLFTSYQLFTDRDLRAKL